MKLKSGFTLLEILIVVVIIGILAGLAIPKFNKSIESAKGKEAYVNLQLILTAEKMYYLDYGSYTSGIGVGNTGNWDGLIPDYLPENPNVSQNGNWSYGFSDISGYEYGNYIAARIGGQYGWVPGGGKHYVGMYLNGDMANTSHCAWPWPPD